jgi:apolipoprotein N-acyltransferase
LRKILLAALSGLLYACSFPTYSLFPLAWIWLIPLLFLMEETEE